MARAIGVQFAVGASLSQTVASAFGTVGSRIRTLRSDLRGLQSASRAAEALSRTRGQMLSAAAAHRAGPTEATAAALERTRRAYRTSAAAARAYGLSVRTIERDQARLRDGLARTESALGRQRQLQANQAKRKELQEQIMGTVASVVTVAAPITMAINFESNMADAAKTIDGMRDATGKLTPKYYEMETAVKEMGRTLPLAHTELARLFAAGGQQGMTATKDLKEFTVMAAHMSVAFGMGTDAAAEAIGGYRTALGLSMPQTREMLDLMNYYANTSSATEASIAEVVKRIGSLGNVAGVTYKPMTALAATLTSMKVEPEIAATGIKNLVLAMTAGEAATKSQQTAFAKLGIDTKKLSQAMQKDGPAAIMSVLEAVKKLPKAEQLSIMQEIFGKESLSSIAPLLDQLDLLRENMIKSTDATQYAGAMQQEFENRSKTTANALVLAKNRASELGITLGSAVLPAIVNLLETVGPYVTAMSDFASKHQTATTVVFGVASALVVLKVAALAGAFAATILSDAWALASGMAAALRWSSIASTAALVQQRVVMVATATATRIAAAGQWLLNAAMTANPIGLVVTGVAALGGWFAWCYNTAGSFTGALSKMWEQFKSVVPIMEVVQSAVVGCVNFVTDLWNGVSLYDAGARLMGTLGDGIKSMWEGVTKPFKAVADFFGIETVADPGQATSYESGIYSDAVSPHKTVANAVGTVPPAETTATPGVKAQPARTVLVTDGPSATPATSSAAAAALPTSQTQAATRIASGPAPRSTSQSQAQSPQQSAAAPTISVTQNFTLHGVTDKVFADRVVTSAKARQSEFEKIFKDIMGDAMRLSYEH